MTTPGDQIHWTPRDTPLGPPAAPVPAGTPLPAMQSPPPPKRRLPLILAGSAAAALILIAGGIALGMTLHRGGSTPPPASPATVNMFGTLVLQDSTGVLNVDGTVCRGMDGYDDITEGAQVTVTDEHGTVVGLGRLGVGTLIGSGMTRQCSFDFSVNNLPGGHAFYSVGVTHRGSYHVQADELADVNLTLG